VREEEWVRRYKKYREKAFQSDSKKELLRHVSKLKGLLTGEPIGARTQVQKKNRCESWVIQEQQGRQLKDYTCPKTKKKNEKKYVGGQEAV